MSQQTEGDSERNVLDFAFEFIEWFCLIRTVETHNREV